MAKDLTLKHHRGTPSDVAPKLASLRRNPELCSGTVSGHRVAITEGDRAMRKLVVQQCCVLATASIEIRRGSSRVPSSRR